MVNFKKIPLEKPVSKKKAVPKKRAVPLTPEALLSRLKALPMKERIRTVAEDVRSGRDRFSEIHPQDLAEALGVPDADNPRLGWQHLTYARRRPLEDHAWQHCSAHDVFELLMNNRRLAKDGRNLRKLLSMERVSILKSAFKAQDEQMRDAIEAVMNRQAKKGEVRNWDFGFLAWKEKGLIERALAEWELDSLMDDGMNRIARFYVEVGDGRRLGFEADIEDDGACIDLRTPYDERDRGFTNLRNCVTAC